MAVEVAQAVQVEGVDGDVGGDLLAQSLLHALSLVLADLPSVSRVPHVLVQLWDERIGKQKELKRHL